jgi:hypothetical protein
VKFAIEIGAKAEAVLMTRSACSRTAIDRQRTPSAWSIEHKAGVLPSEKSEATDAALSISELACIAQSG